MEAQRTVRVTYQTVDGEQSITLPMPFRDGAWWLEIPLSVTDNALTGYNISIDCDPKPDEPIHVSMYGDWL